MQEILPADRADLPGAKRSREGHAHAVEEATQILVGRVRIAHLKLHGLPDFHRVADGEGTGALIDTQQIAHEEVTALEVEPVFVNDEAEVQAFAHEKAIFGAAVGDRLEVVFEREGHSHTVTLTLREAPAETPP